MRTDESGNKYSFTQYYEGCARTLRIAGVTRSQATVTVENWLTAQGYSRAEIGERFNKEADGMWISLKTFSKTDSGYLTVYYDRWGKELTISRGCDGVE